MLRERKKSSMKFIQSSSLSRQNEAVTVKLPTTVFVFLRLSVKKKKKFLGPPIMAVMEVIFPKGKIFLENEGKNRLVWR